MDGTYRVERFIVQGVPGGDPGGTTGSGATDAVPSPWLAYLVDPLTGRRVGVTFRGATEAEAVARLERWCAWQKDHDAALHRLQAALRAYHRAETDGGIASTREDIANDPQRLDALERLDRARVDLDAVRRRRPG